MVHVDTPHPLTVTPTSEETYVPGRVVLVIGPRTQGGRKGSDYVETGGSLLRRLSRGRRGQDKTSRPVVPLSSSGPPPTEPKTRSTLDPDVSRSPSFNPGPPSTLTSLVPGPLALTHPRRTSFPVLPPPRALVLRRDLYVRVDSEGEDPRSTSVPPRHDPLYARSPTRTSRPFLSPIPDRN